MKPEDFNRAVIALVEFVTVANTYFEDIAEIVARLDLPTDDAEELKEIIKGARHDLQLAGRHAQFVEAILKAPYELSRKGSVQ